MNLLMDIGNSRIKTAVCTDTVIRELVTLPCSTDDCSAVLADQLRGLAVPKKILISNVAGPAIAEQIRTCVRENWGMEPCFVPVTREWGGLVNGYAEIEQLGVDRWLALLAAWEMYHGFICVVSCGTAVTIDIATAGGRHLGGLIIPGFELMQRSLNQATQGINATPTRDPILAPGTTTDACVSNGALYAISSLLDRVMDDLEAQHGAAPVLLLTGGDAVPIGRCLSHPFRLNPGLVLEGLVLIAGKDT